MKRPTHLVVLLVLALAGTLAGCTRREDGGAAPPAAATAPAEPSRSAEPDRVVRKVIRNAELSMTVASPAAAQRDAAAIAERFGGYLASSESLSQRSEDGEEPESVRVVLRVSSERLDEALDALRKLARRVGSENLTSRDVTEEWTDLDARLKTQRKLEEQYLEIAKSATKVEDMLALQRQLAEVRGEIEKLEGRKRLLDHQVALSTVTVTFHGERPLLAVAPGAFSRAVKRAGADVVNVGALLVIGGIRVTGKLLPVVLLVVLPLTLLGRAVLRRLTRARA